MIAWDGAGPAPRTVRRRYGTLRAVLNRAVECDLIARTPCRGVKLPAVAPLDRPQVTAQNVTALAEAMGGYGLMVYLGAVLGLRWGEVAGLRAGRVDLLARKLRVAEQVTRGARGVSMLGPPKSEAGRRTLSMPVALVELLAGHLGALGLTGADADAFVFPAPEGGHLVYGNWRRRVWVPACQTTGLDGLGFHDLRRANATGLVAEGVDVKTAQVRLGHSDPRLTLAVYAQATTEADRAAADRLGDRFLGVVCDRSAMPGAADAGEFGETGAELGFAGGRFATTSDLGFRGLSPKSPRDNGRYPTRCRPEIVSWP